MIIAAFPYHVSTQPLHNAKAIFKHHLIFPTIYEACDKNGKDLGWQFLHHGAMLESSN